MKSIFIGSKSKPTYLVEIHPAKKQIHIYKPDAKYDKIIVQPVSYKQFLHAPEMIIVIKKKPIRIATTIREIKA